MLQVDNNIYREEKTKAVHIKVRIYQIKIGLSLHSVILFLKEPILICEPINLFFSVLVRLNSIKELLQFVNRSGCDSIGSFIEVLLYIEEKCFCWKEFFRR